MLCIGLSVFSKATKAAAIKPGTDSLKHSTPRTAANCGIDWVNWSNVANTLAEGTVATDAGPVRVTMTSYFAGQSDIFNRSKFDASPYPAPTGMVPQTTWGSGPRKGSSICFSRKVTNPVMLISSLGSDVGNNTTALNFSEAYIVLYDGGGMTYNHESKLTGFEGFAIILFPGEHECINITSDNEEFYSNITWGLSPVTSPVDIEIPGTTCGVTTLKAVGGNGVSYKWYGGGDSPTSQVNHVYSSGFYAVAVTDANGCTNFYGRGFALPVASGPQATIDVTVKTCSSVTLTASIGQTFQWNGGLTPNERENTFTTSGKYSVIITQADGCTSYAEQVVELPKAVISGNPNGCGATTLTASGGVTYLWDGGSSPNTASNTFRRSGTYTVVVTSADGCTATASQKVTIGGPIPDITAVISNCNTATLTATGGVTYQWDGGLTPNSATNTYIGTGTYTASVIVTDANGCSAVVSKDMRVGITSFTASYRPVACNATEATASGGVTYHWSGGQTPNSAVNVFTQSGNYTVTITDANGCTADLPINITIGAPIPVITGNTTGCGSVALTASGGATYLWDGGTSLNSATNTFTQSGTYHVTVSSAGGCSATKSVDVVVTQPVTPAISITATPAGPVCEGTTVNFTAVIDNGGASPTYAWFKNGAPVGTGNTYSTNTLNNNDEITCTLGSAALCATPATITSEKFIAQVNTKPVITVNQNLAITDDTPLQLNPTVTGNIIAYSWLPATGLSNAGIRNPIATPQSTTTYRLTVTPTNGCETYADVTVTVAKEIAIPNTFSPNADGVNDQWNIKHLSNYPAARVDIYNRQGQAIYHSVGYAKPWDGTYKGKLLPVGIYYYVIDLRKKGSLPQTGYITLLR